MVVEGRTRKTKEEAQIDGETGRNLVERRRSSLQRLWELSSYSARTRDAPRWGERLACSVASVVAMGRPVPGHPGLTSRKRRSLEFTMQERGTRSAIALVAAFMRMIAVMLLDMSHLLECFLVERLIWEPPGHTQMTAAGPAYQNLVAAESDQMIEGDATNLMQNGAQIGELRDDELLEIQEEFHLRVDKARRRNPSHAKDLLMLVGAALARNRRSLLPAVRQVCRVLEDKLNYLVEQVAEVPTKHSSAEAKWAARFWKQVRSRCRNAAARHKREVERAMREEDQKKQMVEMNQRADDMQHQEENQGCLQNGEEVRADDMWNQEENQGCLQNGEEVTLMQTSMSWVQGLQEEFDYLKKSGVPTGGHVQQLQHHLAHLWECGGGAGGSVVAGGLRW